MKCLLCHAEFDRRAKYLAHECLRKEGEDEDESYEAESPVDDSDADSWWCQEEEKEMLNDHNCNSSPLTAEQREGALLAELALLDFPEVGSMEEPQVSNGVQKNLEKRKGNQLKEKNPNLTNKTKQNYCMHCKTMQTKLLRHMLKKHKDMEPITDYMTLSKRNDKREAGKLIISKSNAVLNNKILNNNEPGNLIPARKQKAKISTETHVICSQCEILISKKYFPNHKETCKKRSLLIKSYKNPTNESPSKKFVHPQFSKKYNSLISNVVEKMNRDKLTTHILKDELILEFGRRFSKCHNIDKQKHYISSKLRTLADLVLRINAKDPETKFLKEVIHPSSLTFCVTLLGSGVILMI